MGSFLTQCNLTRQSISDNTPCVIIPIYQQSDYEPTELEDNKGASLQASAPMTGNLYHNSMWQAFGSSFTCTYADYGQFKLDETDVNLSTFVRFVLGLKEYAYKTIQGENQSHDLPFDIDDLINTIFVGIDLTKQKPEWPAIHDFWQQIQECNHDQRIFLRDYIDRHNRPRLLQTAVFSKIAWDEMISQAEKEPEWRGESNKISDRWAKIVETWENRVQGGKDIVKRIKEQNAKRPKSSDDSGRVWDEDKDGPAFFIHDFAEKIKRLIENDSNYNPLLSMTAHYAQSDFENGKATADKLYEKYYPLIADCYVFEKMNDLSLTLTPHPYVSQDYSNENGLLVTIVTGKTLIRLHDKWAVDSEHFNEDEMDDEDKAEYADELAAQKIEKVAYAKLAEAIELLDQLRTKRMTRY